MKRIRFFLLFISLFGLTSCDSSIMGAFLNWCWVDTRNVTICYANSTSTECGANSEITAVITVNATGNYGSTNTPPSGSSSANQDQCGNALKSCMTQSVSSAYSNISLTTANSTFSAPPKGAMQLDCTQPNPFVLSTSPCSGPNSAVVPATSSTQCSCNDPATKNPVPNIGTCDSDDASAFTSFCATLKPLNLACMQNYQKCTSSAPATAPVQNYGQWISTNLQVSATEQVQIDQSGTKGTITLTQPLGLRAQSTGNSYATSLQNYQAGIQNVANSCLSGSNQSSAACSCKNTYNSDFCVYQNCMNYDQSTPSTGSGYNANCDCSSGNNSSSNFCLYANPSRSPVTSGFNDFANGGKGILVPFYFDSGAAQLGITSSDPAKESFESIGGAPITQGYGVVKQFAGSTTLSPNQILTFTLDSCSTSLAAPYGGSTALISQLPYGQFGGWSTAYYQKHTANENFNTGTATSPNNIPVNYKYWDSPSIGSQCGTSCSNQDPNNLFLISQKSAGGTFTRDTYSNSSPNACWNDKAEQIQFKIGDGSWTDFSASMSYQQPVWQATYPVGANAGNQNLYLQFNSDFEIPDQSQLVTSKTDLAMNLCKILNFYEPNTQQPTDIDPNHCQPPQLSGGSNGNGQRCYMILEVTDSQGNHVGLNSNTTSTQFLPSNAKIYAQNTKTPMKNQDGNNVTYNLYCWEVEPTVGDNCIDVHDLIDAGNIWGDNPAARATACTQYGGQVVLRGFASFSCCFQNKSPTNPQYNAANVIASVALQSWTQEGITNFWVKNSQYTWQTYPLARQNDIAGLCSTSATSQANYNNVQCSQGLTVNGDHSSASNIPSNTTCYMGNNKGPFNFTDASTLNPTINLESSGGINTLINPFYVSIYNSGKPSPNPTGGTASMAIYGYYNDGSITSRESLDTKRSCFPYWKGANSNDVPGGCPKILGYQSTTDPTQNNNVTKECSNDNSGNFACCFNDQMSLTGDAYGDITIRKETVEGGALLQYGPGGSQVGKNRAVNAVDIVGGLNLYVKSVPLQYTSGQKLSVIYSNDDPNQLTNITGVSQFIDPSTGLACTSASKNCVAMQSVCQEGSTNCSYQPASGSGTMWLRIDDSIGDEGDGDYTNNTGAYNVTLKVVQNQQSAQGDGGIFGSLVSVIETTLTKALHNIYLSFTNNGQYADYVVLGCEVYIIITIFYYILGITKYNQLEFLVKIIKLCVVMSAYKPAFANFMIIVLPTAVWQGQAYLITAATGLGAGTGNSFQPFYMFNQVFEFFFNDLGTIYRWVSMFGIGGGGTILAVLILICCFYYIFAVIDALKAYIIAIISLSLMFAMSPIILTFILFSKTRGIFDNWIKHILQYMLEPVLIFSGLTILSTLVLSQLYSVFSDGVCLKCVMNFIIGIGSASPFNNLMDLCLPGLLPYGFDNQGEGLISLYFTHFGEAALLLILAMILKKYIEFINTISLTIVSAGGRSVTNMTKYNNLVDEGGGGEGGSLASFQKFTGLNKDAMTARKQSGLQSALAGFKGTEGKKDVAETGAQVTASRGGGASGAGDAAVSGTDSGASIDRASTPGSGSGGGGEPK